MYCINCGIEMTEGQKICPICQTKVYHPDFLKSDALPTYPQSPVKSEEINIRGLLFIVTLLHLIPIIFAVILDLNLNGKIDWTGFVIGAVLLLYVSAVLPMWFKRPNPAVFVFCAFVVLTALLWYINFTIDGNWFLTLALPLSTIACFITVSALCLFKYVRRHRLLIVGGGFIVLGIFTVLIEFFMHMTFEFISHQGYKWSLYPMVFLVIVGGGLIVIEVVKPFKESLKKIFFLE